MTTSDARVLDLDEIAEYDGKEMWLQMRTRAAVVTVVFDREHYPSLIFKSKNPERPEDDEYILRTRDYGEKWIMYDRKPRAAQRRGFLR